MDKSNSFITYACNKIKGIDLNFYNITNTDITILARLIEDNPNIQSDKDISLLLERYLTLLASKAYECYRKLNITSLHIKLTPEELIKYRNELASDLICNGYKYVSVDIMDNLSDALQNALKSPALVYSLTTMKNNKEVMQHYIPSVGLFHNIDDLLLDEKTYTRLTESLDTRLNLDVKECCMHEKCAFPLLLKTISNKYFQIRSLDYNFDIDRPSTLMPRHAYVFLKGTLVISEITEQGYKQAVSLLGDNLKFKDTIEALKISLLDIESVYFRNEDTYEYFKDCYKELEEVERNYKNIFKEAIEAKDKYKRLTYLANLEFRESLSSENSEIGGF